MSLTRQFFRDFRPFFRMFEEPFIRSPSYYARPMRFLDDSVFQFPDGTVRPAVDVTEEGDAYILEADLPGVKKENIEVRIEDGGRSVTIEGKVAAQRRVPSTAENTPENGTGAPGANAQGESSNQITSERTLTGRSTFTRTIWLPRPVNGSAVAANLQDGILTVTVPKAEDKASITVPVE